MALDSGIRDWFDLDLVLMDHDICSSRCALSTTRSHPSHAVGLVKKKTFFSLCNFFVASKRCLSQLYFHVQL